MEGPGRTVNVLRSSVADTANKLTTVKNADAIIKEAQGGKMTSNKTMRKEYRGIAKIADDLKKEAKALEAQHTGVMRKIAPWALVALTLIGGVAMYFGHDSILPYVDMALDYIGAGNTPVPE